jgi:antitoxin (DNA-binding transcriptional repressor) of toxin-antitoxin stability system
MLADWGLSQEPVHDVELSVSIVYIMYIRYIEEEPMSATYLHYNTVSEARAHFSALIDAAEAGVPATVRRDRRRAAVVDADRLRHFLVGVRPARAEAVAEGGGWSILLPGLPIAADGETFEDALAEMVAALREYAKDWADHLRYASNHEQNWGLVQIIDLSSDEELRDWLQG